jgi:hypothetical protein
MQHIDASQGVGALTPTFKDVQNRALAPEEIPLFLPRPFVRWPLVYNDESTPDPGRESVRANAVHLLS